MQALYALQKLGKGASLVDAIDSRGLLSHVNRLPRELHYAAHGFKAIARTRAINEVFQSALLFDTQDQDVEVTGTPRPRGRCFILLLIPSRGPHCVWH